MALIKCKECGNDISKKAAACPKCGAVAKKKTSVITWIIGGIFAIGVIGAVQNSVKTGSSSAAAAPPKDDPTDKISLDFSWSKGGFDNVMEANFTVKNSNTYDVKDIKIKCIHSAPSGTKIDENDRIIYEVFPAGKTRTVKNFNMGFIHSQANKSSCAVIDAARV